MKHHQTSWTDRAGRSYVVKFSTSLVRGKKECVALSIIADPDPVMATTLRDLPLASIIDRMTESDAPLPISEEQKDTAARLNHAFVTGARALPTEMYVELAEIYRAAIASSRSPLGAISARFGISKASAAKRTARARKLQLLGPAIIGASGETSTAGDV